MSMHWALAYLGKPWENGAHGPASFDCWGLVRHIYAERYGIDLPAIAIDAHAPLAVRHGMAMEAEREQWMPVPSDEYQEGDVILMSQARHPHHVGLWLESGGVLHSVEGAGVVFQNWQSLYRHGWNVVHGYRRAGQ